MAEEGGVMLEKGRKLTITVDECLGNSAKVSTVYSNFVDDVNVGDVILIDDGQLKLRALEKRSREIDFEALNSNPLKSNKGINLPGNRAFDSGFDGKGRGGPGIRPDPGH